MVADLFEFDEEGEDHPTSFDSVGGVGLADHFFDRVFVESRLFGGE